MISQFCHFIYVWLVWNNADVEIKFIIQFHLFIIYWTIVDYHILYVLLSSARQNKESKKGLFNTNKQKNKYKDIPVCKSERWYANKNKELNNYWIYLKGERNQLLICGFTESRTNKKKNENMMFFMKILQGLMLKHVYIVLILNFSQNMQAAIFPLSVTSLHPFPFTCSTVSKQ